MPPASPNPSPAPAGPLAAGPLAAGPLTADQLAQVAAANRAARKVRRVVGVANFSGWTTGVFGGLTLLGGLFSTPALFLGAGMVFCGWNELRAASIVRRLDPRACKRLALNQLILFAFLVSYCAWSLFNALHAPPELSGMAGADEILQDVQGMAQGLYVIMYGGAIVLSAFVQGLTALYYAGRARTIREYLRATPAWIVDVQRAAA